MSAVSRSLSNHQIDDHFKKNKLYGGCFSKDQLLKKKPGGKFWVINLEDSDKGFGTHWVCVIDVAIPDRNVDYCIYYDPYGVSPPPAVEKFMSASKLAPVYSYNQYQALESSQCGYYCIRIIEAVLKSVPYEAMFEKDLKPEDYGYNEGRVAKMRV
jgi:hypothetical protein